MASTTRRPLQGLSQILYYNLPFYLLTIALVAGAVLLVALVSLPWYLLIFLWSFVGLAMFWSIMSLIASYYIYDRSGLTRYDWTEDWFAEIPLRIGNIHAGLDECTPQLKGSFPGSEIHVLDIFDPQVMTESSIDRARKREAPAIPAKRVDFRKLPFPDNSFDAVFLIFAAHEIRDRNSRELFFGELNRILGASGKILLVEHLRDAWNFLAFGPGFLHFLPRSEWMHAAGKHQFKIVRETSKTPFVRVILWEKGL